MRKIYFFICILLFYSCNQEKINRFFKVSDDELQCKIIDNSYLMYMPLKIVHIGQQLFITDFHGEKQITQFCLSTQSELVKFANRGSGPSEFLGPIFIWEFKDNLYVFDRRAFKLGYFEVFNNSKEYDYSYKKLFQVPTSVNEIISLDEERFLIAGYFVDGRYGVLSKNQDDIKYFGSYPDFLPGEANRPFDAKAMFHQVQFAANYKNKRVAAVSDYVLDIIDFSGSDINIINRIQLSPYDYEYQSGQIITATAKEGFPYGVESISSSNKYLYLAYRPYAKNDQNFEIVEILVYDWSGNPVKKLNPDCIIETIEVINDTVIYGITYNPDPSLVKLTYKID